jgi:hypothetical protein
MEQVASWHGDTAAMHSWSVRTDSTTWKCRCRCVASHAVQPGKQDCITAPADKSVHLSCCQAQRRAALCSCAACCQWLTNIPSFPIICCHCCGPSSRHVELPTSGNQGGLHADSLCDAASQLLQWHPASTLATLTARTRCSAGLTCGAWSWGCLYTLPGAAATAAAAATCAHLPAVVRSVAVQIGLGCHALPQLLPLLACSIAPCPGRTTCYGPSSSSSSSSGCRAPPCLQLLLLLLPHLLLVPGSPQHPVPGRARLAPKHGDHWVHACCGLCPRCCCCCCCACCAQHPCFRQCC